MSHMDDLQALKDRLLRLEGLLEIHRLVADHSHGADERDRERFH